MIMPFLSVTAIGLVIGGAGLLIRIGDHAMWRGFFGAWAGFAAGALAGLVLDVTTQGGYWVALLGHLGAVVGAFVGLRLEIAPPDDRTHRS